MKKVIAVFTDIFTGKFMITTKKIWWQETDEIEAFEATDSFHQPFYEKH